MGAQDFGHNYSMDHLTVIENTNLQTNLVNYWEVQICKGLTLLDNHFPPSSKLSAIVSPSTVLTIL